MLGRMPGVAVMQAKAQGRDEAANDCQILDSPLMGWRHWFRPFENRASWRRRRNPRSL
jgi:hypothetical protein